jgi:signal transduction histidine kinase
VTDANSSWWTDQPFRSMSVNLGHDDLDQVVTEVIDRLDFGADGYFRVKTHTGCLICR